MMKTIKLLVWATLAAGTATAAQSQDYPPAERPRHKGDNPAGAFWPSDRLIDSAINRIVDHMAELYKFDDDQVIDTRDVLKARFPDWLKRNRNELQSLMMQYLEAVMGDEPPTPEEVADWAARATPLIQDFTTLVDQTTEDMRTYLTDQQQVLLDGQRAAMQVGMNYMQQRLATWRDGGYDWETEWPRSETFRETEKQRQTQLQREVAREKARAMGLPEPAGPEAGGPGPGASTPESTAAGTGRMRPSGPKDDWTIYVENFIRRYQLDEGQQNSAYKILRNQQELRDRHLLRHADDIKALEEKQKNAKSDEDKQRVRDEYERLNRPLERYFQQLKDKLETLPTRKQRAAAAQAEEAGRTQAPRHEETKSAMKSEMEARLTTRKSTPPAEDSKPTSSEANK